MFIVMKISLFDLDPIRSKKHWKIVLYDFFQMHQSIGGVAAVPLI
jgi:hypothetical protein